MQTKLKNQKSLSTQSGVSLIISFFVMTIIVAVILAITTLLYNEIKMIRNIGNSVVAFYAADSGVEKVLYYDRKVVPTGAIRGLCSMFSYDAANNPNECTTAENKSGLDSGLYCNSGTVELTDTLNHADGCDPNICDSCKISFTTTLPDGEKSYIVNATLTPNVVEDSTDFTIDSMGSYRSLSRKVELYVEKEEAADIIAILEATATPISSETGTTIAISVEVRATKGVSLIEAHVKDFATAVEVATSPISLTLTSGTIQDGIFYGTWTGTTGSYSVDITVYDTQGNKLESTNLQPY